MPFRDIAVTAPSSTVNGVSVTVPATVQPGDLLIAYVIYSGFTSGTLAPVEAGWVTDVNDGAGLGATPNQFITINSFARVAVAGDAGRTFSWQNPNTSFVATVGIIAAYSGDRAGTTYDGGRVTASGSSATPVVPSITPNVGGVEVVCEVAENNPATLTVGGGTTQRLTLASPAPGGFRVTVADRNVGSGASGTLTGAITTAQPWAIDGRVVLTGSPDSVGVLIG